MDSTSSSGRTSGAVIPTPVKIVVAGGFGAGKTTMVASVSEIVPLSTEEVMTQASDGIDDLTGVERKTTTTVALDFGRITISPHTVLYLFGTPGQDRFWFMWDELARGAIGTVVLVDTRRLNSSFAAIDFFERRKIPFIVAVNRFDGADDYEEPEIRRALALAPGVPVMFFDARQRESSKLALIRLVRYAMDKLPPEPAQLVGAGG
ncbi:ATP/GTP-binding protein [Amycolatopsis acidiphila]|uniref:ATP/GTP-binding protein n=1 Tax=Amycolatopsis acidiphila TaxID=715473 RepID=A0A558A3B6_9PSEU|nr:ATP/GTP-binding protein [Amycolatopsis acidiphila]TVT18761.1 ATP/GTP-binding protein [Amycolatopsis acidiphila]UIJ56951.1 ATP/GTP-binding protein [Amycolatopsis acidiphila]GHG54151.1 ATP-binding protein [Amycolatopsis acidiphila]